MRMMVVGSDRVYAIENFYVKYLRDLGVTVEAFASTSLFYDYYQKNLLNKIIYRAGFSKIEKNINRLFKEAVETFKPDIIWVFKGMEIAPSSLIWAKKRGIKLVNYNPDNPFIFTGKGSGNQFVTDSIPLYDLHFTYNLEVLDQLNKQFQIKTAYLPFGFDLSIELFNACAVQPEINRVCFLGNPDKQRAEFIRELIDFKIDIDVYGNAWEKFLPSNSVTINPPVYGDDLWMVLRRYRVQLNMMRVHNEQSHNMRTFEVPGVGGIMVAPKTKEHQMFFEDRKEVFLYHDVAACADCMNHALSLSETAALEIRNKARVASIERGYHYSNRALQALEVIKQIVN